MRRLLFLAVAVLGAEQAPLAHAQEQAIRINPSGTELYRIAVSGTEAEAHVVSGDLDLTGYFRILDPKGFPSALASEPLEQLNATNWMQVGALGVTKVQSSAGELRATLYEVAKGEHAVLSKRYRGADLRAAAHQWANELVKYFTGEDSFFGSQIAFASGGQRAREIYTVDVDGQNVHKLTQMNSVCMLPTWAPSGQSITFLSYLFGAPDIWSVPSSGGRARRLTRSQDAISGAAWSPDGSRFAVTLTRGGNADIYLVRADGSIIKRLTDSSAIDTSPSFSMDGSQIAFVSNRLGSPQIFIMNADGSGARRLTYQGTYNQTPRWCPRKDTPLIAFTARDEHLRFDLFTVDAHSGQIARLTQNQGDNEEPSWAPNGRAVCYKSSRGGLWIMNPNTRVEHQIYRSAVQAPRWGPMPRP